MNRRWIDQPGLEGLMLAAHQINAEGGILGRDLKLVEGDGTTDTTEMTRLATQLVENDDIVAIAGVNEPLHAVSPIRGALRRADGGLITFTQLRDGAGRGPGPRPPGSRS